VTRPIHMREECAAKFYLPDRKFIECVLLSRECVPYVTRPIHMWETVRSKVVSTWSQVHRMCSIINENVFYHQWECVPYVTRPIHMWETVRSKVVSTRSQVHRMCSIINENVFRMRQYPFICEKFIEYVLSSMRMCSICDKTHSYVRSS